MFLLLLLGQLHLPTRRGAVTTPVRPAPTGLREARPAAAAPPRSATALGGREVVVRRAYDYLAQGGQAQGHNPWRGVVFGSSTRRSLWPSLWLVAARSSDHWSARVGTTGRPRAGSVRVPLLTPARTDEVTYLASHAPSAHPAPVQRARANTKTRRLRDRLRISHPSTRLRSLTP